MKLRPTAMSSTISRLNVKLGHNRSAKAPASMRYLETDNIGAAKPDERFPAHAGDERTINYRHIAHAPAARQRDIHDMIFRACLGRVEQLLAEVLGHDVHARLIRICAGKSVHAG